jgi:hypothetical protein
MHHLRRDARFEKDIGCYNFHRWTANEVNCMLLVERHLMKFFQLYNGGLLYRV